MLVIGLGVVNESFMVLDLGLSPETTLLGIQSADVGLGTPVLHVLDLEISALDLETLVFDL